MHTDAIIQAIESTSAEAVLIYLYHTAGVDYAAIRQAAKDIDHIRADPKGIRELLGRVEDALHYQSSELQDIGPTT